MAMTGVSTKRKDPGRASILTPVNPKGGSKAAQEGEA